MATSVEQIVRQIIEDLSDGVSELVLLVVVLAEQNAPMPSHLPEASNMVNQTAAKLSKIARQLAGTDYKAFPQIADEINEAASAVESATNVMGGAINTLAGPGDRKKGWDGLVDACRVMSGKTIRLLQIVYGAPLKRLQINADRTIAEIDKMDPKPKGLDNQQNQQRLLDQIKPITDGALRQEKYLADRAKNAPSEAARKELQKAADEARQKAQDLVNAVNDAFRDPKNADLTKPLMDLRDAIERGKDVSQQHAPPAPGGQSGPPRPGTLKDAIERAKESARAIPKAGNNLGPANDKLKDDVADVRRKIQPNPAKPYDWNKEMEVPLAEQYKAAREALRSPTPDNKKALEKATDDVVKALDNLANRDTPQSKPSGGYQPQEKFDPSAGGRGPTGGKGNYPLPPRKPVEAAIGNLGPAMDKAINKPHHKEKEAYDKLKDNLGNIHDGIQEKNPKKVAENVKQAVPAAKELANQFRQQANNPNISPEDRQNKRQAADDLDNAIRPFVETAREAVKDLNNDNAVKPFQDAVRKLSRAADRGNPRAHESPLTQDEWNKVKDNLAKARDAAKRGDRPAMQKALDEIKEPMERLRNFNIKKGNRIPDPSKPDGPSDELQKLWDKFLKGAKNNDPKAMDEVIPQMDKAWDNFNKESGSTPQAAADRLGRAVDNLQGAVDSGNPQRYQPAAQALKDRLKDFEDEVARNPDPKVKQAGQKAINEIRPQVDDYLKKAKDALDNPNNKDKAAAAEAQVPRIKKPLAEFKDAASPQQDSVLNNDKHGQGVKKALGDLSDATKGGNPQEVKKALDNLKNALQNYNDNAKKIADNEKDPGKKDYLNKKADELKKIQDQLNDLSPQDNPNKIDRMVDPIAPLIDDYLDTLQNDAAENAIKGAAKANNLAAYLKAVDDDEMDLGDLLNAAGELSDLMRGMIGDTQQVAEELGTSPQNLTEAARNAMELDKLLKGGGPSSEIARVRGVSGGRGGISAPLVSLDKARSFEDVAHAVAYNIQEQSKAFESQTGNNVAKELANLAAAARSGDKQKLLLAAKAAAGHLLAFSKELNDTANKIPGKNAHEVETQSHLIKCSQGIRNYATHLKILASVKAASIEQSKDTDESLSHIATDLGDIIAQSLNSMSIVHKVILKH